MCAFSGAGHAPGYRIAWIRARTRNIIALTARRTWENTSINYIHTSIHM